MTVYVVYDHVRYEGCSPPLGAFSRRDLADAFIEAKKAEEDDYADKSWSVVEMAVDAR